MRMALLDPHEDFDHDLPREDHLPMVRITVSLAPAANKAVAPPILRE